MSLNYTNSVPLHIQLKQEIEEKIFEGVFTKKIPSERELMDQYYVSRSTVRKSISQLVNEGILEIKRGKGTFVAVRPINDWLGSLRSTNETIQKMGMDPGAKLITSRIIELTKKERQHVGLDQAYFFERVRYANKVPIGIERHYYPVEIGKQLIKFNLNKEAFYDLLEVELGVKSFEAEQCIYSVNASEVDSDLLKIPVNFNLLNAQRMLTDINGDFVEFENAFYRADMYSFKINLSRKNNQ